MESKVQKLRRRLRAHRGKYPEIAKATGLSLDWLRKFSSSDAEDMLVSTADKLEGWLDANEKAA